jgi:AcrR family transcriptional regulator
VTGTISRASLTEAALDLIQDEGLDALSMRTLADRIGVKAASLYWHVRDREELLELAGDALLARVAVRQNGRSWRESALALCAAVTAQLDRQRDARRVLMAAPGSVRRSAVFGRLVELLVAAGVDDGVAREVASMMLGFIVSQPAADLSEPPPRHGKLVTLAVDSGSRGVLVRAGAAMETLFQVPHDPAVAAPAVVRGERVVVRRLRGGKRGEVELNPAHPWRIQVQGPTWNTLLELGGIDLREIHVDSSATNLEVLLPRPRGVVPIHVSSGVVGVRLRRPPGTDVVATLRTGAVKTSLDAFTQRVAVTDTHWETPDAGRSPDRYELEISGGAVRVSLDDSAPDPPAPASAQPADEVGREAVSAALEVLLDGVASRSATVLE